MCERQPAGSSRRRSTTQPTRNANSARSQRTRWSAGLIWTGRTCPSCWGVGALSRLTKKRISKSVRTRYWPSTASIPNGNSSGSSPRGLRPDCESWERMIWSRRSVPSLRNGHNRSRISKGAGGDAEGSDAEDGRHRSRRKHRQPQASSSQGGVSRSRATRCIFKIYHPSGPCVYWPTRNCALATSLERSWGKRERRRSPCCGPIFVCGDA